MKRPASAVKAPVAAAKRPAAAAGTNNPADAAKRPAAAVKRPGAAARKPVAARSTALQPRVYVVVPYQHSRGYQAYMKSLADEKNTAKAALGHERIAQLNTNANIEIELAAGGKPKVNGTSNKIPLMSSVGDGWPCAGE